MPLDIPDNLYTASAEQFQDSPWVWLWEITVDITVSATSVFHVTSYPAEVAFDRGDGDGSFTYKPFPMKQGRIRENNKGDIVAIDLTVCNASQLFTHWAFKDGTKGFVNMPAILCLCRLDLLSEGPAVRYDLTIEGMDFSNEAMTLRMSSPNYWTIFAPRDLFQLHTCRWQFKSLECGYYGSLTECNKTLPRCREIGVDEQQNALPVEHPKRFGAFPSMLRKP